MVEYVNEPVSVEVQLRPDETVRPVAFLWRGRRFQIESWGRKHRKREHTPTGDVYTRQCYLVQTAGPVTWELCQVIETAQWTLTRHWATKHQIV